MAAPDLSSEKVYTYADYKLWEDEKRRELINGVPYSMTPAPGTRHQTILGNLFLLVGNFIKNKECMVFMAPCDVLLPDLVNQNAESVQNVFQPDLFVVCDEEKIKEKYIFGAPDWVVEILSPSTAKKDQNQKKHVYENAGVKEFWVVCPVYATVSIYRLVDGKLLLQDIYDEEDELEVKVLPGLKICAKDFLPTIKRVKENPSEYQHANRN